MVAITGRTKVKTTRNRASSAAGVVYAEINNADNSAGMFRSPLSFFTRLTESGLFVVERAYCHQHCGAIRM